MGLDSRRGMGQMLGMKIILALAVLMLGAVGCDSEKPSAITADEAKLKAAKARYYEREEGDKKELERIHQSAEYKAWLAEGEAIKRRREEDGSRPIEFYSLQPNTQSEIDEERAENEKLRQQLAEEQAALKEERDAEYSIRGDQMRKNGIPYAVRSLSGRWVPLVGRD
jgi:hypothetical protein